MYFSFFFYKYYGALHLEYNLVALLKRGLELKKLVFALGIAAEILFLCCACGKKRLQRIARPEGERPNY
jgi:hypothetical protein